MKTTVTFTSTLDPQLMKWVDHIAKSKKRTRRAVLEDAIKRYKRDLAREHLERDFKRFANDPDIVEIAEWGMKDYAQMLKDFDA